MRWVLWFMGLFAVAVASALFAGSNHAVVSLFWHPYRMDVSLNLFLIGLGLLFVVLHLALRAFATLVKLPVQAQRWRHLQRERALTSAVLDAIAHQQAGRSEEARQAATLALSLEESLRQSGLELAYAEKLAEALHCLTPPLDNPLKNIK